MPGLMVSLFVSFLLASGMVLLFAFSDIPSIPQTAVFWIIGLGVMNILGGRSQNFLSINMIGASRASLFVSSQAPFAAIFAVTFAGEGMHPLVAPGNSIREGMAADRRALLGYLMALVAAACYGGTNVIAKELTKGYGSPLMISTISLPFGIILLWPLAGREAVSALRASRRDPGFVVLAGLSGLAAATGVICLYFALQRADVTVVSPIVSINPW